LNAVERTKLALNAPHARVLRVTRIQYDASGHPLAREDVVLPLDRFPGLTADVSYITELAQCYGLSLGRATERISIVPATSGVAMHLGITAGTNVMKLDRVAETADGEPVEWRVTFRKV
jgi:GntR family transcriptional regulator